MGTDRHYQLRHAAGRYWLLDMQQEGLAYRKPVVLNECAAFIWKRNDPREPPEPLAQELQKTYGISMEQAMEDTQQFIQSLKEQGLS